LRIKYILLFVFIGLLATSCYKDEITFSADLTKPAHVESFLSQFLNVTSYSQLDISDEISSLTLQNGTILKIPPRSFINNEGKVLETGRVTIKATYLKKNTPDLIIAPPLEDTDFNIRSEKCFKIIFIYENDPLYLVRPIDLYFSTEKIENNLTLFSYSYGYGLVQWNELTGDNYKIESGLWSLTDSSSFVGIKISTNRLSSWICLGEKSEISSTNKFDLRVQTDNLLNTENTLVYFIDKNKVSFSKLTYLNSKFIHEINSSDDILSGYILIISDIGKNDSFSFALEEIHITEEKEIFITTKNLTKEEIRRVLYSL